MKKQFIYGIAALMLLLFISSCQQEQLEAPAFEPVLVKTTLAKEGSLTSSLSGFISLELSGRTETAATEFGTLDFNNIIKRIMSEDQPRPNYTIRLTPPDSVNFSLEYLVLIGLEEGYRGYIMQYQTDFQNILTLQNRAEFTGHTRLLDFKRNIIADNLFENGQDLGSYSNGRTETLYTNCECTYDNEATGPVTGGTIDTGYGSTITCVCDAPAEFQGSGSGGGGGGSFPPGGPIGFPGGGGFGGGGSGGGGNPGGEPGGIPAGGSSDPIGIIDPRCGPGESQNDDGICIDLSAIVEELIVKIEADPFALIEIDCNQIQNWQALAQHKPTTAILNKIKNLQQNHEGPLGDWNIQYLEDAGGTVVNMDYFSVKVNTLPINPATGQRFTANSFQDYFRREINAFAKDSSFEPYCEISAICNQETLLWESSNPVGAIAKIDINFGSVPIISDWIGNDGVVLLSDFQTDHWKFMTLEAPYDNSHPVSGTRQFGYEQNSDGSYDFFVRGVDRFTSNLQENAASAFSLGSNQFSGADKLWEGFQEKLNIFINGNGGSSVINTPVLNRPDWDKISDVLQGRIPVSEIGCN